MNFSLRRTEKKIKKDEWNLPPAPRDRGIEVVIKGREGIDYAEYFDAEDEESEYEEDKAGFFNHAIERFVDEDILKWRDIGDYEESIPEKSIKSIPEKDFFTYLADRLNKWIDEQNDGKKGE